MLYQHVLPIPDKWDDWPRQIKRSGSLLTWKDLMKVHSRVRIPSPRDSSFTSLITRNSRKKVMEILALSSEFCSPFRPFGEERGKKNRTNGNTANAVVEKHTHTRPHARTHTCRELITGNLHPAKSHQIHPRSGKESEGHARVSSGFLGKKKRKNHLAAKEAHDKCAWCPSV